MDTLCINNQSLEVKEWNGRRVVTFKDVDRVHQRKEGTARHNFWQNHKHFIANVDYFLLKPEDKPKLEFLTLKIPPKGITLLTETGYLMLVKSFTDDTAWNVQRELVNSYFRTQPAQQQLPAVVEKPKRLFWLGHPVMIVRDAAKLFGMPHSELGNLIVKEGIKTTVLSGSLLARFKSENDYHSCAAKLMILYWSNVQAIAHALGVEDSHKDFLMHYFEPRHNESLADEDMRIAVEQARLLQNAAWNMKDEIAREYTYKAATALLINVGLWDDRHHGYNGVDSEWDFLSAEGYNKSAVLFNARKRWPYLTAE